MSYSIIEGKGHRAQLHISARKRPYAYETSPLYQH